MNNLSLFNIGFRCENVCEALSNYDQGISFSLTVVNDSIKIIQDCLVIREGITSSLRAGASISTEFIPLLIEAFPGMDIKMIISELNEISSTLKNVSENIPDQNISKPYDFFRMLSKLCLIHSNKTPSQLQILSLNY
ncbi:MAG: hypothetical protein JW915_18790 [Chitinispirillaceae bacterium]|nr:hypothetical protein [Chitinispirillaceae bacterium]